MQKFMFSLLLQFLFCRFTYANVLENLESHLIKHSNEIAQSKQEYDSARIEKSQSFRDSYLPSISANLFSEKTDSKSRFGNTFFDIDNPVENGLNAKLNYSLLNNFQGYFQYNSSLNRLKKQNRQYLYQKNQKLLALGKHYLELSKITFQLNLLDQLLNIDHKTQKTTQRRFNKGLSPRSELNRAKFRSLDIQDEISRKELQKQVTINNIQKLFNVPFDLSEFNPIKKENIDSIQKEWAELNKDINLALNKIENRNDLLIGQKLNLNEKNLNKSSELMKLAPRLTFDLNHKYFQQREIDFWTNDRLKETTAILRLDIPLFEGLQRYTDIQKSRIQEEIGLYQLRQTHIILRESIRSTINEANFFIQKIERDTQQRNLSESILKASLKKYQLGSTSLRDLVEDQRFHQRQLIQLIDSQFEFLKRYIEYHSYLTSGENYSIAKLLIREKG